MFIIAQVLGVLGTISNVISMQLKKKQQILMCFVLAGIFFTSNYFLLGGYTGGVICFVATMQTFINYFFDKKRKEIPRWLIITYFILSLVGGIVTYKSPIDILPILGGLTYTWSIIQKRKNTYV